MGFVITAMYIASMGRNVTDSQGKSSDSSSDSIPGANNDSQLANFSEKLGAMAMAESFPVRSPSADMHKSSHLGEQALDYIGTSETIKSIFSLPYAPDKSISVGIHNVEGCLLIDSDPVFAQTDSDSTGNEQGTSWRANLVTSLTANTRQQSAALSAINALVLEENKKNRFDSNSQLSPREYNIMPLEKNSNQVSPRGPKQWIPWEFNDIKMLVGSDALVYRSSETSLAVRVEDASKMREQLEFYQNLKKKGLIIPDYQSTQLRQPGKRTYADALRMQQLINPANKGKTKEEERKINPIPRPAQSLSAPDLDQVQLQTCIVPSKNLSLPLSGLFHTTNLEEDQVSSGSASSPVCTVIDAYLDNIIANVPQLGLCLSEKGFIQSVKLLDTNDIPSSLLKENTLDTRTPFEVVSSTENNGGNSASAGDCSAAELDEGIFSPAIMDMNASTLLRFLKSNCTRNNATYLLHREAGQTDIQLYDVSAINCQRQKQWMWWLATMSYKFASRLRQLSMDLAAESATREVQALQRTFRTRQRSLLQNTLNLLEEFADMGGASSHDSFRAEVCEKLAESFLRRDEENENAKQTSQGVPSAKVPTPATSTTTCRNIYSNVSADSLTKAQDYLFQGIKILWKAWKKIECRDRKSRKDRRHRQNTAEHDTKVISVNPDYSSSDDEDGEKEDDGVAGRYISSCQIQSEAMAAQLYSLHDTLINVSLRLAEYHLESYFSSSLMQTLRTTARRMAHASCLFEPFERSLDNMVEKHLLLARRRHALQLQYTRLWELCGHFARSFADDELWRERGHAAGDDVISVLRDVEAAFPYDSHCASTGIRQDDDIGHEVSVSKNLLSKCSPQDLDDSDIIEMETKGLEGDLTALVTPGRIEGQLVGVADAVGFDAAKKLLEVKRQLQRDRRRVLVAAAISYKRAIVVYEASLKVAALGNGGDREEVRNGGVTSTDSPLLHVLRQRLGDACNEVGKILLNELRAVLTTSQKMGPDNKSTDDKRAAEPLLSSSEFWFQNGIFAFDSCGDPRNAAFLRANVCQCYKLRANAIFSMSTKMHPKANSKPAENLTHAEICLQEAAKYLQAAHESLGEREVDPETWDMISNELAATFLVLGVRRRQALLGGGSTPIVPQMVRLSPGEERSIAEPMEKALKIYQQSRNTSQAAAVHYQLAMFYTKIWTSQRDEARTREKLSGAFQNYRAAHEYFFNYIRGNEPTLVLCCLDEANLYATVAGEECLCHSLLCCFDTAEAFSRDSIDFNCSEQEKTEIKDAWLENMRTLAASVEERVFKTLRSLVKLEDVNSGSSRKYKEAYRAALNTKMTAPNVVGTDEEINIPVRDILCVQKILQTVRVQYQSS